MATIAHLLGHNPAGAYPAHSLLSPGRVGIELELEGIEGGEWPSLTGWRRETDGSLRDGMEYVFDGAAGGAEAVRRIKTMGRMLNSHQLNNSFRCSTHIHLDVRDMEFTELEKLVAAYCMYEGVMFDHCSMERRFSNFCTPFFLNSYLTRNFTRMFSDGRRNEPQRFSSFGNWPKYSALNLKPITNYGSVEFRGSHALATEEEILALAQRMLHLKRVAVEGQGVPLMQFIEGLRARPVAEVFPTGLTEGYAPDERLLDKGYSSAIDIATGASRIAVGYAAMEDTPAPTRPAPTPADFMVGLNRSTLDTYNIFYPSSGEMRISKLVKLVKALRNIQGIAPPDIFSFMAAPESFRLGVGWTSLVHYAGRQGMVPQELMNA